MCTYISWVSLLKKFILVNIRLSYHGSLQNTINLNVYSVNRFTLLLFEF